MPDRIIRDRARRSPTLQAISDAAERAWWRLTTAVDDYGRFDAAPEVLLSDLFPRRPAGWTPKKMRRVLEEWEMEVVGLVHLYRVTGDRRLYGHCVTWADHQRERESKPKYPNPPCRGNTALAAKCRESQQSAAYSERRESRDESRETSSSPRGRLPQEADQWPSPESLVTLYNANTPAECPSVQQLSPARRLKAQRYLSAFPDQAWWEQTFQQIHASKFLRGLKKSEGHESFIADFDWLLSKGKDQTENAVKVHDGRYKDR